MRLKLSELCRSIRYGPHLATSHVGAVHYLKAQHFDDDSRLLQHMNSYAQDEERSSRYLLTEGQLIVAGKGKRQVAWAYRSAAGPCIASSLFYVLTVNTEIVDPRYLEIILNASLTRKRLSVISLGASVPVIPKQELGNLLISLPPLDRQLQIIKLNELQARRRSILQQLTTLSRTLDEARTQQIINALK